MVFFSNSGNLREFSGFENQVPDRVIHPWVSGFLVPDFITTFFVNKQTAKFINNGDTALQGH